jgi:hypothetical protein
MEGETLKLTRRRRVEHIEQKMANQKLMFMGIMALVFVLASFSTDARKLGEADDASFTPPKHLHYGMLPKGVPVPPSGPSRKSNLPPPPPHRVETIFHGLTSRGPVPPSAPNVDLFYVNGRGPVPPSAPNAGPGK